MKKKKGIHILHPHGYANRGKRSYIKLTRTPLKNKQSAKSWARRNLTGEFYRYVSVSKVKKVAKDLFKINK